MQITMNKIFNDSKLIIFLMSFEVSKNVLHIKLRDVETLLRGNSYIQKSQI